MAAQEGHGAIVTALIEAGADVNRINEESGNFPLLQAAQNDHGAIATALIEAGADVNRINEESGTFPLLMAAHEGHGAIVTALIEAGADVNRIDEESGTFPLLQAAQEGHGAIVTALIEAGADVNRIDEERGSFPLLQAAQNGHGAIVTALIEAGADVNRINEESGRFPLLMAAQEGHGAIVTALIEAGADVNRVKEESGTFPLLQAAQNGHAASVTALIEAGADVHQKHEFTSLGPADVAVAGGHDSILQLMVDALDVPIDTLRKEATERLQTFIANRNESQMTDWLYGLDLSRDWPMPDLFAAEWAVLSDEPTLRRVFSTLRVSQVQNHVPFGTPRIVRATSLDFYPGWTLVEVLLERPDGEEGIATLAINAEGGILLDGTSSPIHALRQMEPKPLHLPDEQTALDYLRFFCAFVQSEEGPFRLIETVRDAQLMETLPDEAMASFEGLLGPAHCSQTDDGAYLITAATACGQALFQTQFKVRPNGLIEVIDDDQKMTDLPFTRHRFVDGLRTIAAPE